MSNNQKLTTYQKLTRLFNSGLPVRSSFEIPQQDLITTKSREEFEFLKLQAQQTKYVKDQWQKVENDLYQKSFNYQMSRIAVYSDAENMEAFPEISSALSLYANEACLDSNTNICLSDNSFLTIEELYKNNHKNFKVKSFSFKNNSFIESNVERVIFKGIKDIYEIKLNDESIINCTLDHKWLGEDNNWYETKDIINKILKGGLKVTEIKFNKRDKVYDLLNSSVDSNFGVKCNSGMIISHNCTLNEDGKILQIYSDSERIKTILEDLFFNRLDLNSNLYSWARNLCKLGDNFLFLKIGGEKMGIVGTIQLPNIEIERIEGDTYGSVNEDKKHTKFLWRGKNREFNTWEIAHFRLLGKDSFLPYGTSLLSDARRYWRLLLMSEDAMCTYRVSRASERRVFKINVGNMSDEDVEAYINKIANKFKRQPIVDPKTGQVDVRFHNIDVTSDFFIPVRNDNAGTVIDTLPGASNLSDISDIEYLQNKLLASMQIPKEFIGFDSSTGEGKNLSMMDIRFARNVNRVQQALVQELNKIAIIHLYLLGFEEELSNFSLRLNNPSTQAELLKLELYRERFGLYRDATAKMDNGFSMTSMTWAKKNILGMSDDEIKLDLQRQKIESVAAQELNNITGLKTGIFDDIDRLYKSVQGIQNPQPVEGSSGSGGGFGGGFGGGDFTSSTDLGEGGLEELGGEQSQTKPDTGQEQVGEPTQEQPQEEEQPETFPESIKKKNNLITEEINTMIKEINKFTK